MRNPCEVTTGEVRLSYVHLFKPYAKSQTDKAKYSVTCLLPKGDEETKGMIDSAMQAAAQAGLQKVFQGFVPPNLASPIHDGDGIKADGMPFPPECHGHWVFTASNVKPAEVVDISCSPMLSQEEVYSGMYGRVAIRFFPYNNQKKGIGISLDVVMKTCDGAPRMTAASAFGAEQGSIAVQQGQVSATIPIFGLGK